MMKRLSMIITFLFLALIVTGCGNSSYTTYNIQNGKKTECRVEPFQGNGSGDGICTWPFYQSMTDSSGTTTVYECSNGFFQCNYNTPITVTSPVTSSPTCT